MAKAHKSGFYSIATIGLDPDNFRHKSVKNGQQALKEMLSNKKHKVLELAQDIVKEGTVDPSVKLIISPNKKNKGQYVVLEGNRRVTALKALHNPGLASSLPESSIYTKLSKEFLKNPISDVECVELSPAEAKKWIKRKHYRGVGGTGTLEWDAVATARSDAADGKYAKWLAVTDFLEMQGYSITDILEKIDRKTTTVERVLGAAYVKKELGIQINSDGSIKFDNGDNDAGAKLLYKMLEDMADPSFIETKVTNATLQEQFLEKYKAQAPVKGAGAKAKGKAGTVKKGPPAKKGPLKRERRYIADKGLDIEHNELHNFYFELTKLPADTYPHSAAAMIRIFLEKATMVFLDEMKVTPPKGVRNWEAFDIKLRTKVSHVLGVIDPSKSNAKLKPAREIAAGNQDKLYTLDILNEYIHNHGSLPISADLTKAWDKLHPYFAALFDHINASKTP